MTEWTRPSVYVQWKGTDVCLDFYCPCAPEDDRAGVGHFDGYHAYALECPSCGRKYRLPDELHLTPLDDSDPFYSRTKKVLLDD